MTIQHNRLTLKDLPKILKEYKERGIDIIRFNDYISNSKAWYVGGELLTDREIINSYGFI